MCDFLQNKDVRIIIGLMYEDQFRQISCQVLLNNRRQYFASPAPQTKSLKAQNYKRQVQNRVFVFDL